MHAASFACGVWFGVCLTLTLLVAIDAITRNDDDI